MCARPADARHTIARELSAWLRNTRVRRVYFAEAGVAPPPLAYVTSFPRLSVPLSGRHPMEIAQRGKPMLITPTRGQVVFAGGNCWNKPDWSQPLKVLTFLFGKRQIGVSLVRHEGGGGEPQNAIKTTVNAYDRLTQGLVSGLVQFAARRRAGPLERLLTESLLHACLLQLESPATTHPRKAARTFESLCLYVQENFQSRLTRESVAASFGLTPNHVSRLFRREGSLRFSDYLTLVRIDRAKFMLREYGGRLKEIAANCGFNDVAYFCRVFNRVTKVTPTEYRLRGL